MYILEVTSKYIWNVLVEKGTEGLRKDANKTMNNANYLLSILRKNNISAFKNKLSSTVINLLFYLFFLLGSNLYWWRMYIF